MFRKLLCVLFLLLSATLSFEQQQQQQQDKQTQEKPKQQTPVPPKTHLKVGMAAPDFTLIDTTRKEVKLSDFKGKKNVVLAFYVLAFTGG